jgi:hypothetical protein
MIAPIMGVQPHDRFFDGVRPSGSGAVPPGDLAAVRPHSRLALTIAQRLMIATWLLLRIRITRAVGA